MSALSDATLARRKRYAERIKEARLIDEATAPSPQDVITRDLSPVEERRAARVEASQKRRETRKLAQATRRSSSPSGH